MRLNFSGADEDEIREGIRRIGEIVREQVALYGTLTGAAQRPAKTGVRLPAAERIATAPERTTPTERDGEVAKILRLPAARKRAG